MRDEDLHSYIDYTQGQREAASRVLVEIANILNGYEKDILIVGGWVPDLLFPGKEHVGSIDVDVLINHLKFAESSSYETIERILLKNGYTKHPEKSFSFVRNIQIDGVEYSVDLDILAGMYGGTAEHHSSQRFQGLRALKATGGNFAFEVPPTAIKVDARRPDGAMDSGIVYVVSIVPYLMMKTKALGRGKEKDAYDIYFCVKNYAGGTDALAEQFRPFLGHGLVQEMLEKLQKKFASVDHSGPTDVAKFLDLNDDEEIDMTKRDAFELINSLIKSLIN